MKMADVGPIRVFNVFGGVAIATAALAIPMYMFGKRLRAWWFRADILKKLHM
jgi:hypothetical protein